MRTKANRTQSPLARFTARISRIGLMVGLASGAVIGIGHDPAGAGANRSAALDPEVQAILRDYPEATWTPDGQIELQPGMDLLLPLEADSPAEARVAAAAECEYHYLCLYEHKNFGGIGVRYSDCWKENLPYQLRNEVSSLISNQTSGTMSYFYDGDYRFGEQRAYGFRLDMSLDRAPDGNSWNDRMDSVIVC